MKKFLQILALLALLGTLSGLSFLMGSDWGQGAAWATAIYGILISLFLGLQIYGFVYSQVHYSENVEDAKFDLLEREGIITNGSSASKTGPLLLPCLYCGVDSGPALNFFIWMIGGGLLAFLCFYGWGYFNGKFSNDENASRIPLEAEEGMKK